MKRLILGALAAVSIAAGLTAPAHAARAGATHLHYTALVVDTRDFGYWMTYYARNAQTPPSHLLSTRTVNANIVKHLSMRAPNGTSGSTVGLVLGRMHLMNTPSDFRFHVDSYTDVRATETVRWLFGSNPHTPVVRLVWSYSPVGWSITQVTFLRVS
jgi:hypothetical protein